MRYRDQNGQDWADIIDSSRCIRTLGGGWLGLLGEIESKRG
jgi:hypothetical protein